MKNDVKQRVDNIFETYHQLLCLSAERIVVMYFVLIMY